MGDFDDSGRAVVGGHRRARRVVPKRPGATFGTRWRTLDPHNDGDDNQASEDESSDPMDQIALCGWLRLSTRRMMALARCCRDSDRRAHNDGSNPLLR